MISVERRLLGFFLVQQKNWRELRVLPPVL